MADGLEEGFPEVVLWSPHTHRCMHQHTRAPDTWEDVPQKEKENKSGWDLSVAVALSLGEVCLVWCKGWRPASA